MLTVTVQYADGTHKARTMENEDAHMAVRDLLFQVAASALVVAVTVSKADPVTRLMEGRIR